MELVYLWVENYKNIRNQGFNFSPRFECEFFPKYDKDGKLEDNCELKITPKDYVSIFPDNINITAIVGENGSGKSSLLETLTNMNNELKKLLVYYDNNQYFVKHTFSEQVCFNIVNIGLTNLNELNCENKVLELIENKYQKIFLINKEKKYNPEWGYISENYLESNRSIQLIINLLKNGKIKLPFQTPKKIIISLLDIQHLYEDIKYYIGKEKHNFNINFDECIKCNYEDKNTKLKFIQLNLIIAHLFSYEYHDLSSCFYSIFYNNNPQSIDDLLNLFLNRVGEEEKQSLDYLINILNIDFNTNNYFSEFIIEIEKLDIQFIDKYRNLIFFYNSNNSQENNIFKFSFDIDLSGGEYQFLLIFCRIYENIKKNKDSTILIDEGEIFLHPNWQKKYIDFMIQFFYKNYDDKIQLILTSHSSFILSDIPKRNVIFLDKIDEKTEEKYPKLDIKGLENGNCINVSKHIKLKTFGANIHTLLSDGFFMSNGLMGEFAKSKIEEIKKFYELVKFLEPKNKKYKRILKILYLFKIKKFNHIQSIIGEPFLQTIIKNYLDDLYLIFSNDKTLIDKELIELEKRKTYLESLKNGKN
ncbi:AAA family ATPase [Aliarcobacter butzleri]|uniref:AAA family ATPase n=1 Tax=Aliarcobacter butzleri TaxID=28197 RepID=UPI002B2550A3|nr:AAA family ATPase [Aliarcobacter butzleri]